MAADVPARPEPVETPPVVARLKQPHRFDVGPYVEPARLPHAIHALVLRLLHHVAAPRLEELLRRLCDRLDELEERKGNAALKIGLDIHRGNLTGGRFDPDIAV